MNLKWSSIHELPFGATPYLPFINPCTGRHCDIGHIIDPGFRRRFGQENPVLELPLEQVSLAFDLIAPPNSRTHIVPPGKYRLFIEVAAENAQPVERYVEVTVIGPWYSQEEKMLRDGVGIAVLE
jgi:hypothetical protein